MLSFDPGALAQQGQAGISAPRPGNRLSDLSSLLSDDFSFSDWWYGKTMFPLSSLWDLSLFNMATEKHPTLVSLSPQGYCVLQVLFFHYNFIFIHYYYFYYNWGKRSLPLHINTLNSFKERAHIGFGKITLDSCFKNIILIQQNVFSKLLNIWN